MCIIVDTNVFPEVILADVPVTAGFRAVKAHIEDKKSKLIWGGSKLESELKGHLKLIGEMSRANKVIIADSDKVNAMEAQLKKDYPRNKFDDEHIVALAIISGARLVCTVDGVLQTYLKDPKVFPKKAPRPSICTKTTPASVVPSGPFPHRCYLCK